MRKLLFLLLVLSSEIYGQNLSPLLTPMTSNVMNSRPEIVRELQMNFDKQIPNTKPGLVADIIDKKLINFKDYYFNKITKPEITYDESEGNIKLNFPFNGISPININIKSPDWVNTSIESIIHIEVEKELTTKLFKIPLENVIKDLNIKKELSDNIFAGLYNIIIESDAVKGIPGIRNLTDEKSDYLNAVCKVSSKFLVNNIIENVKRDDKLKNVDFTIPLSKLEKQYMDEVIKVLNKTLEDNTIRLKAVLLNVFDDVQTEINKITSDINKILVSGNIGISLSEGTGDFGTGLQLLYNINSHIQGGIYLNGSLAQSDTTLPKNSLAALQLRFLILKVVQIETLGSFYFGSGNFKSLRYFELGGGFSVNAGSSIIIGTGYFQEGKSNFWGSSPTPEIPTIRTFALFIRSTVPSLPAIYIGSSWEGNSKPNFGFKLSYPLNNKF